MGVQWIVEKGMSSLSLIISNMLFIFSFYILSIVPLHLFRVFAIQQTQFFNNRNEN